MTRVGVFVAAAGLASPVLAQDSVSNAPLSGQGDAVSPYDAGTQVARFVVDLDELTSSWGTTFGIGPVLKLGRANPAFYNSLAGAAGISQTLKSADFDHANYRFWDAAGGGIHPSNNNPGNLLPTRQVEGLQFALAVNEFESGPNGTTTPYYGGVLGAIVRYDPANPSRLYVARVQAAVNGPSATEERSAFGFGSVDSDGNTNIRADDFGLNGTNPLIGNNYFRVRLGDRGNVVNVIDNSGGSDATDWIDLPGAVPGAPGASPNSTSVTMLTPGALPEEVSGRPVVVGASFNNEYIYESAPGTGSAVSNHRDPSVVNQRGSVHVNRTVVFPGTVATAAMVGNSNGSVDIGDRISLWGVNADGSASGMMTLEVPLLTGVTDNDDGFNTNLMEYLGNYRSQVAFRGGNSQVAVGRDQDGNLIVAAMAHILGLWSGQKNPTNCVLVAKVDANNRVSWTLAAHTGDPVGSPYPGKVIRDGRNGATIGRVVEMYMVTGVAPPPPGPVPGNVTNFGPSISSPMVDSVGNVYFVAACEFNRPLGFDYDTALLRAVYDPATFSYQLEKVFEVGDVFDGQNSATPYQVSFLDLIDADSISSAAPFSHNIVQQAAHGRDPAGLDTADPRTLGGLVVNARIVYDTDGSPGFNSATDENYRVALFVGDVSGGGCYADCDTSTGPGVLDIFDFLCFQNLYAVNDPYACNCDTSTGPNVCDIFDFLCFQNAFAAGCP